MREIDVEAAKLAALPLEELEALAAPVMAALRTKRETLSKEERRRRRQEFDRLRREKTVAVTVRMDDAESAAAIRSLVKQMRTLAQLSGRSVADVVAAAVKRLPVGRRKAGGSPKTGKTKNTNAKPKNVGGVNARNPKTTKADSKAAVSDTQRKTEVPTANNADGGGSA